MGPRQPNQKAVAAKERKAAHAASKDAAAAKVNAAAEAAEWNKGSNVRSANRAAEAAAKADEAARKKREKADLLAAEEAAGAGAPSKAKKSGMSSKKDKKKKKNELELLEEALVGNAEKQAKAAKKKERERKEREERMQMERDKLAKQKAASRDPLFANTHAMIGSMDDSDNGQDDVKVGRAANRANAEALSASSIEGALSALSTGGEEDQHPEKRMKALHKAFEERMLPEMKQQYPGLRLGQYKDKIFQLWKKSPENPMNQPRPVLKS